MLLLTAMLGCSEFFLNPNEPPGPPPVLVTVVDRHVQHPTAIVDVLVVVDDTSSMQQELVALGEQVPALIDTLDSTSADWQLGVVTASLSVPWPGYLLGTPYVITPATPEPSLAFADRLPVADGVGEQGIAAALLALEQAEADGPNAGFRRPGAMLQVLFVSDADDRSAGDDPVGELLTWFEAHAGGTVSALVGEAPAGCASATGTAQVGERYLDLVDATGGREGSICSIDFASLLEGLAGDSVELSRRFSVSVTPLGGNMVVTVDGSPVGFVFDPDALEVELDEAPPSGAIVEIRYAHQEVVP